jgi:hypothetical protein
MVRQVPVPVVRPRGAPALSAIVFDIHDHGGVDLRDHEIVAGYVDVVRVVRVAERLERSRPDDAGDAGRAQESIEHAIENRLVPRAVERRQQLGPEVPTVRLPADVSVELRLAEERSHVHLVADGHEAVVGRDDEGRPIGETGVRDRRSEQADAVVGCR